MIDLDALEAKARAATPGEWDWDDHGWLWASGHLGSPLLWYTAADDGVHSEPPNAAHIAAFDPVTAIALIARIRELEAKSFDWNFDIGAAPSLSSNETLIVWDGLVVGEAYRQVDDNGEEEGWWWANTHSTDYHDGQCYPIAWKPMLLAPSVEEIEAARVSKEAADGE